MENMLTCMISYDLVIPLSFSILYLKENSLSLARFLKIDDLVGFLAMADGGYASTIDSELFTQGCDVIMVDAVADALVTVANHGKPDLRELADLSGKLADPTCGFEASLRHDLELLATALGHGEKSKESRQRCIDELKALAENDAYLGALKAVLVSSHLLSHPQPAYAGWP